MGLRPGGGTRIPVPRDCRYPWAYSFGAVRPAPPGKRERHGSCPPSTPRPCPGIGPKSAVRAGGAPSAHAILILDGGHKAWWGGLAVPHTITPRPRPPSAPARRKCLARPAPECPRPQRLGKRHGHRPCLPRGMKHAHRHAPAHPSPQDRGPQSLFKAVGMRMEMIPISVRLDGSLRALIARTSPQTPGGDCPGNGVPLRICGGGKRNGHGHRHAESACPPQGPEARRCEAAVGRQRRWKGARAIPVSGNAPWVLSGHDRER